MAQITGEIYIDFDTDRDITEEQFKALKKLINKYVNDDLDMFIYDACSELGFESNSVQNVVLDNLECDYED